MSRRRVDRLPAPLRRVAWGLLRLRLSRARRDSNRWLRSRAAELGGRVLSIGSGSDHDGEGCRYRDYFPAATGYTTSEVTPTPGCDLILDVRSMPEIADDAFDVIFCSGVLEHVDDHRAALEEMTRILTPGGVLLLGVPFRQGLHLEPHDFWRFTEHGLRYLLEPAFEIDEIAAIDPSPRSFPASYWVRARKRAPDAADRR